MEIVWWNPDKIACKGVSIIKTGRVETESSVYLFYRNASGQGTLGPEFELRINRKQAA